MEPHCQEKKSQCLAKVLTIPPKILLLYFEDFNETAINVLIYSKLLCIYSARQNRLFCHIG